MSSYMLRVCSMVAQIIAAAGIVFWAGVSYQRLNTLEERIVYHRQLDWHNGAAVRITAIETNVLSLTKSVDRLVNRLDATIPRGSQE